MKYLDRRMPRYGANDNVVDCRYRSFVPQIDTA
jgi:hypothetical protein